MYATDRIVRLNAVEKKQVWLDLIVKFKEFPDFCVRRWIFNRNRNRNRKNVCDLNYLFEQEKSYV